MVGRCQDCAYYRGIQPVSFTKPCGKDQKVRVIQSYRRICAKNAPQNRNNCPFYVPSEEIMQKMMQESQTMLQKGDCDQHDT